MSGIGYQVTISNPVSPALASLRAGLRPEQLQPIIGRAARNVYREHLAALNSSRPNQLGGPRTNFYASAAQATQFSVVGDYVIISINQVGMGLRYFGGTVTAGKGISSLTGKPTKFLTIPARAEAHGKRASEFNDLVVLWGRNGPYALARAAQSLVHVRRDRETGVVTVGHGKQRGGEVLFWLVKEATFQPDPTVLPEPAVVERRANEAVAAYAQLLWDRRNPPPAGGAN